MNDTVDAQRVSAAFVRSFVRSFARSLVRSFVRSLVRAFVRSCVRAFVLALMMKPSYGHHVL